MGTFPCGHTWKRNCRPTSKKGTTLYKSNQTLEAHEAKTIIKTKICKNAKLKTTTKISGKQCANINLDWPLNS
jgi:hypothetical protein